MKNYLAKAKILQLAACLFIYFSGHTQNGSGKELTQLQTIIFDFLSSRDSNTNTERPSEFILCLLNIDSSGRVSDIHLLADDKNKDSAYNILSRMEPAAFKSWKEEKHKGKTIIIPVMILGPGDSPAYIEALKQSKSIKISGTSKIIMTFPLQYFAIGPLMH